MTTPNQNNFMSNFLRHNNIKNILDIGANCGHFSSMCKSIIPDCNIIMIEGNNNCEDHLRNMGIKYYMSLLSDSERDVTLYLNRNNPVCTGTSYYKEILYHYDDAIEQVVKTTTLDNLLKNESIIFDFVKIDTQGSEYDIIKGGEKTIRNASYVFCECPYVENPDIPHYNKDSPDLNKIKELLYSYGFTNHMVVEDLIVQQVEGTPYKTPSIVAKDVLFSK